MAETSVVLSYNTDPYKNLALEKFLLDRVSPGEVFLYLWQNERTVVCGRNQNIWKECRIDKLLEDGGFPARRLSGGGAVYHDLGNLNFSFMCCEKDYNLKRQQEVIIRAVESFGIEARASGRNDIVICGVRPEGLRGGADYGPAGLPACPDGMQAKFSGCAFYKTNPALSPETEARVLHHGTIMADVDRKAMEAYLDADEGKYASKGVDSVKSRVCNLSSLNAEITVKAMADALIRAFEEVYALKAQIYSIRNAETEIRNPGENSSAGCKRSGPVFPGPLEELSASADVTDIELKGEEKEYTNKAAAFFASDEWLFGNNVKFNVRFCRRFGFGDLDVRLYVEKGIIKETGLFSDAMDQDMILEMAGRLEKTKKKSYSIKVVEAAIADEALSRPLLYGGEPEN